MSAKLKVYQSTVSKRAQTYVILNGKPVMIEFVGGTTVPIKSNGKFVTSNTELQNAIEASPDFNSKFVLLATEETEQKKEVVESTLFQALGIHNGQQAKEYLMKKFPGTTFRELTTKAMIISFAKSKNIEFPEWSLD